MAAHRAPTEQVARRAPSTSQQAAGQAPDSDDDGATSVSADYLEFSLHISGVPGMRCITAGHDPSDTLGDLRHYIASRWPFPVKESDFHITYGGRPLLGDDVTLMGHNIQCGTTLDVTLVDAVAGGGKRARSTIARQPPRGPARQPADRQTQQIQEMEITERCISPAGMADPLISTCVTELRKIRDDISADPHNRFNYLMGQTDPALLKDLSTVALVKNDETRYIKFAEVILSWMHNKVDQVVTDLENVQCIMRLTMEHAYTSAYAAADGGQVSHVTFQKTLTEMLMKMSEAVGAQKQKNVMQVQFETALAQATANVRAEMAVQVQAAVQSGNLAALGLPVAGGGASGSGAAPRAPGNQGQAPMEVEGAAAGAAVPRAPGNQGQAPMDVDGGGAGMAM